MNGWIVHASRQTRIRKDIVNVIHRRYYGCQGRGATREIEHCVLQHLYWQREMLFVTAITQCITAVTYFQYVPQLLRNGPLLLCQFKLPEIVPSLSCDIFDSCTILYHKA